ncbi:hypothetical protein [Streptomyces sp. FxanaA7]|nr:hypothetical protein [Streptomyces sp. FxanaA7]
MSMLPLATWYLGDVIALEIRLTPNAAVLLYSSSDTTEPLDAV